MTEPINPIVYRQAADGSLVPLPTSGPAFEALRAEQEAARLKRIADAVAEHRRDVEEHKRDRERRAREEAEAALDAHLTALKGRWLRNGGQAAEWPAVERDHRRRWLEDRLGADDARIAAAKAKLAATGQYQPL